MANLNTAIEAHRALYARIVAITDSRKYSLARCAWEALDRVGISTTAETFFGDVSAAIGSNKDRARFSADELTALGRVNVLAKVDHGRLRPQVIDDLLRQVPELRS